jgi:hypothetical protein
MIHVVYGMIPPVGDMVLDGSGVLAIVLASMGGIIPKAVMVVVLACFPPSVKRGEKIKRGFVIKIASLVIMVLLLFVGKAVVAMNILSIVVFLAQAAPKPVLLSPPQ